MGEPALPPARDSGIGQTREILTKSSTPRICEKEPIFTRETGVVRANWTIGTLLPPAKLSALATQSFRPSLRPKPRAKTRNAPAPARRPPSPASKQNRSNHTRQPATSSAAPIRPRPSRVAFAPPQGEGFRRAPLMLRCPSAARASKHPGPDPFTPPRSGNPGKPTPIPPTKSTPPPPAFPRPFHPSYDTPRSALGYTTRRCGEAGPARGLGERRKIPGSGSAENGLPWRRGGKAAGFGQPKTLPALTARRVRLCGVAWW